MSGFFREDRQLQIKICGITNADDAEMAIGAGADALGFNFYRGSKRYIDIGTAKSWLAHVPEKVLRVAVLVNPTLEEALEIAAQPFIDALQLHGHESPDFCAQLKDRQVRFAKAVRPERDGLAADFHTRTLLLDADSLADFGGTGRTFPWRQAQEWIEHHPGVEFILAGGLNLENVAEAIRQVRPFAVDVTTGVESAPGRKDAAKVRDFIAAARALIA